jgi:hypothetical protein
MNTYLQFEFSNRYFYFFRPVLNVFFCFSVNNIQNSGEKIHTDSD